MKYDVTVKLSDGQVCSVVLAHALQHYHTHHEPGTFTLYLKQYNAKKIQRVLRSAIRSHGEYAHTVAVLLIDLYSRALPHRETTLTGYRLQIMSQRRGVW